MNEADLAKVSLALGSILLMTIVLPFFYKVVSMLVGLSKDDNFMIGANIIWTYILLFIIAITNKVVIFIVDKMDVSRIYEVYERLNEFWTAEASNVAGNDELKTVYLIIEQVRGGFELLNALSVGVLFLSAGLSGYMIAGNKNRQQMQNDYIGQFIMTTTALFLAYMLYYGYSEIGTIATFSPKDFEELSSNWWREALL